MTWTLESKVPLLMLFGILLFGFLLSKYTPSLLVPIYIAGFLALLGFYRAIFPALRIESAVGDLSLPVVLLIYSFALLQTHVFTVVFGLTSEIFQVVSTSILRIFQSIAGVLR